MIGICAILPVCTSVSASKSSSSVPKPPGMHDEGGRELHEHHLAGEEVLEGQADVLIAVAELLVGQLDVEATTRAVPSNAPLLAASMSPGPPPEITAKPASESSRAVSSASW